MASRYPQRGDFDVVHVASASRDVAADDPRGWRLGGGVTYAALTTARLGLRTAALIGADALASEAVELELLRDAGVVVRIEELAHGPVFENVETPTGRVQTCLDPGDPVPVVALPESWLAAPVWLVVPVANETRAEWAAAIPPAAKLGLGWQGLLRVLVAGERVRRLPPTSTPLIRRANLVSVSRNDLEPGTDVHDLATMLQPGAQLLVTNGRAGGHLLVAPDAEREPPQGRHYRPLDATEVDPTGAGDIFMAALVAALWLEGPAEQGVDEVAALRWAAAAAALAVERIGLPAVPNRDEVLERMELAARPS
jgi:sugar/nucleoside kinase (ribokinase family)